MRSTLVSFMLPSRTITSRVYTEIHRLHAMERDFLRDHVEPFGANMPLGLVGDCVLSLASWNTGNPMEQKRAISNLSK